ncbi:MAG: adenosylcobinamide-GDP ribazoletransferase [Ktedonobacteraceae bacterium]
MFHKLLVWFFGQYTELVAAMRFLTVLPLPGAPQRFETSRVDEQKVPLLKLGSAYFPLVGVVLALLLYLLQRLFGFLLPHLALAAVLVVALVLLTGGLHLDGLMDTCDGLLGGQTPERRLEIMRDSRVGSFGVLGGICILLLKFALFASLASQTLSLILFIVLPCARWAMVLALRVFPSARPGGLGATFRQTVTLPRLVLAGVVALLAAMVMGRLIGVLAWFITTLVALLLGFRVTRLIGGLTGDSYGAIEEITEVTLLLLLVCLRSFL